MAFVETIARSGDAKRHIWLVSLLFPFTPVIGTALAWMTGQPGWLWLTVVLFYLIIPVTDIVLGEDKYDLLGLIEGETQMSVFYKFMVHATLPCIYIAWLFGAAYVVANPPGIFSWIAIIIGHGYGTGFAINAAHETGHKTDKVSKWVALLMLVPSFLGHFRIEHNRGHHSQVSTPHDHATARFNESYWAFITREVPGAWTRSWAIESERAHRKGYSRFSLRNEVMQTVILQITIWSLITLWLGPLALVFLILNAVMSTSLLSSQNYVAHYGLLREKRPDGKYFPCQPEHSWNCNTLITNITSYNLARHSDHHAHPSRHYQHLRTFKDAPHLPYGYATMFMMAYIPPLFFKVMNPRVLANVDGDMSKVLTKDLAALETKNAPKSA